MTLRCLTALRLGKRSEIGSVTKIDGEARVHDKYGFMVMTSEVDERGMDKSIKSFMVPKMFSRRATADSKRNAVYIIFILMKDAYKR